MRKLSGIMSLSDWQYVKERAGKYALIVAAIGSLEQGCNEEYPVWGTNPAGTGRDWILNYDYYNGSGGKNPAYKGFTNQIDVVSNWLKEVFVLPVDAHNLYEFSRNYWKAGTTQADRDAWAKAVWAIHAEIVNDYDDLIVDDAKQIETLVQDIETEAAPAAKPTTKPSAGKKARLKAEQLRPLLKKKPFVKSVKDFLYSKYRKRDKLTTPTTVAGHLIAALIQMFGNDTWGDCVEAALCNALSAVSIPEGGAPESAGQFTEDTALGLYSDITGFNPDNPNTDQGTVLRAALEYVRTTGVKDQLGNVWKCLAYLLLSSWDEMVDALLYFGSVVIGLQLPESALQQFEDSEAWTVVASSPIAGGHCVVLVSLNPTYINSVTWDEVQAMVKDFYDKYCDEAWAILWPQIVGSNGLSPEEFTLAQLEADLNDLNTPAVLTTVTLSGTIPQLTVGTAFNLSTLTLVGQDQDGDPFDITGLPVTWSAVAVTSDDPATISGTQLTPTDAGGGFVSATVSGVASNTCGFNAVVVAPTPTPVPTPPTPPISGLSITLSAGIAACPTITGGSGSAVLNGVVVAIDPTNPNVRPFYDPAQGRVYVPVRFVAEMLGATVVFNPTTNQIVITTQDQRKG